MLQPHPSDHVITTTLEAELTECRKLVGVFQLVYYTFIIVMGVPRHGMMQ